MDDIRPSAEYYEFSFHRCIALIAERCRKAIESLDDQTDALGVLTDIVTEANENLELQGMIGMHALFSGASTPTFDGRILGLAKSDETCNGIYRGLQIVPETFSSEGEPGYDITRYQVVHTFLIHSSEINVPYFKMSQKAYSLLPIEEDTLQLFDNPKMYARNEQWLKGKTACIRDNPVCDLQQAHAVYIEMNQVKEPAISKDKIADWFLDFLEEDYRLKGQVVTLSVTEMMIMQNGKQRISSCIPSLVKGRCLGFILVDDFRLYVIDEGQDIQKIPGKKIPAIAFEIFDDAKGASIMAVPLRACALIEAEDMVQ